MGQAAMGHHLLSLYFSVLFFFLSFEGVLEPLLFSDDEEIHFLFLGPFPFLSWRALGMTLNEMVLIICTFGVSRRDSIASSPSCVHWVRCWWSGLHLKYDLEGNSVGHLYLWDL